MVRHKEIARSVKGQVPSDPRRERALCSIGTKFNNPLAAIVRLKEIARTVKDEAVSSEA